jgi:hypothetical protein
MALDPPGLGGNFVKASVFERVDLMWHGTAVGSFGWQIVWTEESR